MNSQIEALSVYTMLSSMVAIGIWFIVDKNEVIQIFGLVVLTLGLGMLFSTIHEVIVEESKQPSRHGVEQ